MPHLLFSCLIGLLLISKKRSVSKCRGIWHTFSKANGISFLLPNEFKICLQVRQRRLSLFLSHLYLHSFHMDHCLPFTNSIVNFFSLVNSQKLLKEVQFCHSNMSCPVSACCTCQMLSSTSQVVSNDLPLGRRAF